MNKELHNTVFVGTQCDEDEKEEEKDKDIKKEKEDSRKDIKVMIIRKVLHILLYP